MIDVLFVSKNRLAYVQQTFPALLANTDWSLVSGLYIADDGSTDGTREFLIDALRHAEGVVDVRDRISSPPADQQKGGMLLRPRAPG